MNIAPYAPHCSLHPTAPTPYALINPSPPPRLIKNNIMRKRRHSIVLIDEFRTSKTCSQCLQGPIREVFCHDSEGRTRSAWALKRCPWCGNLHGRDRNASTNIGRVFLHHAEWGQGRPGYLAREGAQVAQGGGA